jgi:excisionase family DNA binding protein
VAGRVWHYLERARITKRGVRSCAPISCPTGCEPSRGQVRVVTKRTERATPPPRRAARGAPAAAPEGVTDAANSFWDAVVEAAAARVMAALPVQEPQGWLDTAGAAEYLCCSRHRIYTLVSARRIPHEREGGRLLFDRAKLDEWVREGGGK